MNTSPKIYLFFTASESGDGLATAIAEDGNVLAQHYSSNETWGKHDIGLNSTWHHDAYKKYYPDGYEVVWIDNIRDNPIGSILLERNKAIAKK